MASLIKNGIIVSFASQAPAPSKDYIQLVVTWDEVIVRWWKIVPPTRTDSKTPPIEYRDTYEDFIFDVQMQEMLKRFGTTHLVTYLLNIVNGHIDYLPRLSTQILYKIMTFLSLQDIFHLSLTSKMFQKLSNDDTLWQKLYRINNKTPITMELMEVANELGWKKMFFTNKLQLQVQLRRKTLRLTVDSSSQTVKQLGNK